MSNIFSNAKIIDQSYYRRVNKTTNFGILSAVVYDKAGVCLVFDNEDIVGDFTPIFYPPPYNLTNGAMIVANKRIEMFL